MAEETAAKSLAWLPVPLFAMGVAALAVSNPGGAWLPPILFTGLNVLFITTASLLITALAAVSFWDTREPIMFFVGSGAFALGLGALLAGFPVNANADNFVVTVFNCSAFLAALYHLIGAVIYSSAADAKPRLQNGAVWLLGYLAAILLVGLIVVLERQAVLPRFFVEGAGGTAYDIAALWGAAALFAASAFIIRLRAGSRASVFVRWYANGLFLFAVGLAGVSFETQLGSPINWVSRISQYAGSVYMITGVLLSGRRRGAWGLPLERALQESEGRYRNLVDMSPDAVFVHTEGHVVYANSAAARLVGVASPADLLGVDIMMLVTPESRPDARERIRREYLGEILPLSETTFLRADGGTVEVETIGARVDWSGKPAIQVLVRNITERKRAQESMLTMERRLLHIQRLESLGVMAGGIAHDFNNILQAILGNAEVASTRLQPGSPAIGNLQELSRAAGRARDLTRQMLAYAGKGRLQVQPFDVNDVLREMQEMIRISVSRKAEVHYALASQLPPVEADPSQVRQAVMNLVINASEALGEDKGSIRLQTGFTDCDEAYLHSFWEGEPLPAGRYVYLEVADTGCGMDASTRSRIFDPFFTTKFTGRGLGLAAVIGIVRGHKGAIRVYSEPGRGSTFRLLFPAGQAPAQSLARSETFCREWQGKATVLLVDDEESVRNIGRQMMEHLGFCVMTAAGGAEALAAVSEHRDDINCVILDLAMPSMDGEEVFQEMRKMAPGLKIVLSSGFNEQTVIQQWEGKDLAAFIQKPYNLQTLDETMRKVLGA